MMNLGLIIDLCNFQFSPSILDIYSLAPKLWKITIWSLEHKLRFWKELRMDYG
jgi:hypothetical protein